MSAGTRIRAERKRQKLTLKALSEKADISISYLGDIEKERSRPSLARLIDISKALNRNPAYFLEEDFVEEDNSPCAYIAADDKLFLEDLLNQEGFKEILREFDGFGNWSMKEKAELISFLKTKRTYREDEF